MNVEPHVALLLAADAVAEASKKEGTLCDLHNFERTEICNLPWNHPPPHSWEPEELKKALKRAPTAEIRRALSDSKQLAEWKEKLCCAELADRAA